MDDIPASGAVAESAVLAREAAVVAARTRAALSVALSCLSPQDQIMVRLHFGEGLSIADVARALHLEQKPLYRQLERCSGRCGNHSRLKVSAATSSPNGWAGGMG